MLRIPARFIKGFKISRQKMATIVDPSRVDAAITIVIEHFLDRDGFKDLACGDGPNQNLSLVIVLDEDDDEETLRQRSLGDIHPSILKVKEILEGPDVWERF